MPTRDMAEVGNTTLGGSKDVSRAAAANGLAVLAAAGALEAIGQLLALGAAAELRAPRALSTTRLSSWCLAAMDFHFTILCAGTEAASLAVRTCQLW